MLPQLTELLTNYGEIAMMWFDTPEMVTKEQSRSIRRLIERLQPHCLINSRIGNGLGDYRIIEQKLMNEIDPKPWEACLTMGANWGYNKYDTVYKKPDMMIRNLTDVVSKGGNLLLNIGPNPKAVSAANRTRTQRFPPMDKDKRGSHLRHFALAYLR